jgi:hypothetical protein
MTVNALQFERLGNLDFVFNLFTGTAGVPPATVLSRRSDAKLN